MKYVELTNGVVVTVRSEPYPPNNPLTIAAPNEVECGWSLANGNWIPPISTRKTWDTSTDFIEEFTLSELAAVQLSTNPTIAALRLILSAWSKPVWSDDPRIQLGLATMVSEALITAERSAEILSQ